MVGAQLSDIGVTRKTYVARRVAHAIDPDIDVVEVRERFPSTMAINAIRSADVVVACLDTFRAREAVNAFCRRYLIPLVDIGITIRSSGERLVLAQGQVAPLATGPALPQVLAPDRCRPRQGAPRAASWIRPESRCSGRPAGRVDERDGRIRGVQLRPRSPHRIQRRSPRCKGVAVRRAYRRTQSDRSAFSTTRVPGVRRRRTWRSEVAPVPASRGPCSIPIHCACLGLRCHADQPKQARPVSVAHAAIAARVSRSRVPRSRPPGRLTIASVRVHTSDVSAGIALASQTCNRRDCLGDMAHPRCRSARLARRATRRDD